MKFRIKDIKLNISVYFAAIINFALLFIPDGGALTTLLCCILHEAGHLTAITLYKGKVKSITLGAYGMRIDTVQNYRLSPKKEIIISLAGPIVNFILIFMGLLMKNKQLISINICLGIFNLLPVGTTDGQNALFNLIILHNERSRAESILKMISTAFLIVVYLFGILLLIKTKSNFSLIIVAVYMTIINKTILQKNDSG